MLHSMTGFGSAQYEGDGVSFALEIRTLNNRFLKTVIKTPETLAFAERVINQMLKQRLARGSVTYTLHMRHMAEK